MINYTCKDVGTFTGLSLDVSPTELNQAALQCADTLAKRLYGENATICGISPKQEFDIDASHQDFEAIVSNPQNVENLKFTIQVEHPLKGVQAEIVKFMNTVISALALITGDDEKMIDEWMDLLIDCSRSQTEIQKAALLKDFSEKHNVQDIGAKYHHFASLYPIYYYACALNAIKVENAFAVFTFTQQNSPEN